jgi:capsular exopolysaccharide synthesis family protein
MSLTAIRSSGFVDLDGPGATALRRLRASIGLEVGRRGDTAVLFTATHPGEGASTLASNYALLTSAAGQSTLLIDANLGSPSLHQLLGEDPRPGLVDVIVGDVAFEEGIRQARVGDVELSFMPAGSPVRGSADVLNSDSAADLLATACSIYETVIIDSPPVLAAPDAAILGARPQVDTVVVVDRHQRRRRAIRTITELRRAGANILGVVVNTP